MDKGINFFDYAMTKVVWTKFFATFFFTKFEQFFHLNQVYVQWKFEHMEWIAR